MHPSRAAQLMATLGILLLLIALALRGISLSGTYRKSLTAPLDAPAESASPGLGHYTFSADGKQVTFEQQVDMTGKTGWFSMPVAGGPINPVDAPSADLGPFQVRNEGVFIAVGEGYSITPGSPPDTQVSIYALAPNKKAIAFAAYRPGGKWGLYILYSNGRLDWLGEQDSISALAWSPDGQNLAFVAPLNGIDQIFRVERAGLNLRQLTSDPTRKISPRWSPDGSAIAYLADSGQASLSAGPATPTPERLFPTQTPQPEDVPSQSAIYIMDAGGANPRLIQKDAQAKADLAWINPGGALELAYTMRAPGHSQTTYLYGVNPQTGRTRRIYPPLAIAGLQCPASLPRGGSGTVKALISNSGLKPMDAPLLVNAGPQPFPVNVKGLSAPTHLETVSVPAGDQKAFSWTIPAAPGLVTYLSVRINIGGVFPMAEAHCAVGNSYYGLANLPFLPAMLPLIGIGLALCIPWLLQRRRGWLWAAWLIIPVIFILLINAETWFTGWW